MFGVSTAFVLSMECLGLDSWGVHSICSLSGTCKLVFYLFIYFLVAWRVAFMVHWDGTSVVVTAFCSAHEAFGLVCFHGAFRVPGTLGRGALVAFTAPVLVRKCWGWMFLWLSQHLRRSGCPSSFCGVESVGSVYGTLWRDPCGVYSISSLYGALGLNVSCGVYCVFYC